VKLSIASVSLSGDLAKKLEAIAAAGFKGVEIFENDLLSFDGTPADVCRRVADLGLEIVTFQPFRDFEGMPPESRERIFARASEWVLTESNKHLSSPRMRRECGTSNHGDVAGRWAFAAMTHESGRRSEPVPLHRNML
jgi:sugar phosphate isomerase/epimerase